MPKAIHTLVAEAERVFGPMGTAELATAVRAQVARLRILRECATPGDLARRLIPGTIQTPMLDAIDAAMVDADTSEQLRWVINTPPQEGKALALDTPIATPQGWITMGEIQVGAIVFDRYGKPCKVTYVSPIRTGRTCYTVRTGDGESIVADAEHRWVARLDRKSGEHTHTTETLARSRNKNAQIIGPADLALPTVELPLDPYVLGAWLGDGHSDSAVITCTDPEILDRIRAAGIPVRPSTSPITWRLAPELATRRGLPRGACSPIRAALVKLGVFGKGNKHIPISYMRASGEQRLALLQGLVDTDGYVHPKGQVEFTSISRRLAENVRDLVFTLGAKATIGVGRATLYGRDCGPKYRVKFYLADAAYLPRKAIKCKGSSVATVRYVWAEPTETVPVRCIEVDSDTHTYLAGRSLLPTHNTSRICRDAALWFLLRNPARRIIIASYQQNLAERSTLAVRQLIEAYGSRPSHPDEDDRLGISIDPSRAAAGNWRLAGHEGGMVAVGIGSGTTGRPGDVIIIDDPVADAEAADSEVQRNKTIDWWTGVVQTRLVATSIVIVVQTRWNPEDLSGWIIKNDESGGPARYRVLAVSAQAEVNDPLGRSPGEWLVSARNRSVTDWEDIRTEITKGGARWWFALYQQRPAPPSGDTFRLEWFDRDRVWQRPPGTPPIVVIDPADNTGSGDEAGILVMSTDSNQHIYLGPDYSGHMTTARWVRVALLAVVRHEGAGVAYEQSLSGLDRSVRTGWRQLWKQARALHRHALAAFRDSFGGWAGTPDMDVVTAVTVELCHPDDPDTTWRQVESELLELWPLVEGVLLFPDTGPSIRRIIAKGTKQRRMQIAAPLWEQRRVSHVGALPELERQLSQWQPGQDSPDRADCAIHGAMLASGATVAVLSTPSGTGPGLPTRSTRSATHRSTVIPRSTMTRR